MPKLLINEIVSTEELQERRGRGRGAETNIRWEVNTTKHVIKSTKLANWTSKIRAGQNAEDSQRNQDFNEYNF